MPIELRYRQIVWDFDGTLAASLSRGLAIYNQLAARHGFVPVENALSIRSLSTRTFLRRHKIPLWRLPALTREFLSMQREGMDVVNLCDGVATLLDRLTDQEIRHGILSSNAEENIRACLAARGIEDRFDWIVGCSALFGKRKALKSLLKTKQIDRDRTLCVGDEARDVAAARKNRLDIAAVTWGLHDADALRSEKPTYLVDSPSELFDIVLKQRD